MNEPMPENSSPKISIITIVRNDKKGIERTLASVEREKNYLVEYIIIDGASTDGTVETIESHLDIVDNFISEQDNGIYDAMNKGVRLASGDVICMINAGDELEPGAINLVLNSLEIHGSHSIYFGDAYYSYEDTGSKRMVSAQAENIIWKMSICHQAVFIPKSVYYKYGLYSLKYRYAADFDFILRVYMAGERFFYVNGVLAVFYTGGASDKKIHRSRIESIRILHSQNSPVKWRASVRYIFEVLQYYVYDAISQIFGVQFAIRMRKLLARGGV